MKIGGAKQRDRSLANLDEHDQHGEGADPAESPHQPVVEISCARRRRQGPPRDGVGGRERESNPPETGSLPHSDLKSERPTRDDSPPSASAEDIKGANKSS